MGPAGHRREHRFRGPAWRWNGSGRNGARRSPAGTPDLLDERARVLAEPQWSPPVNGGSTRSPRGC